MAMKDELAELRAFKATTTPAATTGAAHPGKRARVQQDTLPAMARFRGAARCFYDFQFRGEGERCGEGIVNIAENQLAQAAKMKSVETNSASLACFRGVAPTSNSGEKGSRCENCQ